MQLVYRLDIGLQQRIAQRLHLGSWQRLNNQWYWQPAVMLTTPGWRPYWERGHWVCTANGWYWSSDNPCPNQDPGGLSAEAGRP
jgi:hypothetical protein